MVRSLADRTFQLRSPAPTPKRRAPAALAAEDAVREVEQLRVAGVVMERDRAAKAAIATLQARMRDMVVAEVPPRRSSGTLIHCFWI